jgi:type 1 fimbria pilin
MFKSKPFVGNSRPASLFLENCPVQTRDGRPGLKVMRSFLFAMLFLLTGIVPLSARADITCNSSSGTNLVLAAGTISVPANLSIGSTISTLAPSTYVLQCKFLNAGLKDTSGDNTANFSTTTPLAYGTDVYQTNIPGLGVRYIFNSPGCNATNVALTNGAAAVKCSFSGPLDGPYMPVQITVTTQLVVTGAISGGISNLTTSPQISIIFTDTDSTTKWGQGNLYTGSASGAITQATCSVTQANTYVPLATADTRAFAAGAGAVFAPTPFSLTFSCSAGAKVSITLTDNVNPANRSNTLQLTSDSSAKGVGIQVLNSAGPILFGADSSAPGNTNQWLIGDSPSGQLQVPMTARYISTGPVSAGTVKALATFTLSYQ